MAKAKLKKVKHTKKQIAVYLLQNYLDEITNDGEHLSLATCLFALGMHPSNIVGALDVDLDLPDDAALYKEMVEDCAAAHRVQLPEYKGVSKHTKRNIAISILVEYLNATQDDDEYLQLSTCLHALGMHPADMVEALDAEIDLDDPNDADVYNEMIKDCVTAHNEKDQVISALN